MVFNPSAGADEALGPFSSLFFQNNQYSVHLPISLQITFYRGEEREIFRFAQHPPHTRFDTMGGFFDQYKELLGTLSPCDMVHLSYRSCYVCYPFKPEMCSKFVKYTLNL